MEDRVIDNVAVVVIGTRQVPHNVTSRLDIGDTFVCITIIFGGYVNIVLNVIIFPAILTTIPSQPPSSFSSQTLWLSLSRTSYINLYLCIITVILRIQSWLSESQRNTIPVPEKTIFLRLEICNQSISMKSPAKRKWNEEHNKGKMILLAMLLCLKTFLILKMFEGGIWSEKLLINRDFFWGWSSTRKRGEIHCIDSESIILIS